MSNPVGGKLQRCREEGNPDNATYRSKSKAGHVLDGDRSQPQMAKNRNLQVLYVTEHLPCTNFLTWQFIFIFFSIFEKMDSSTSDVKDARRSIYREWLPAVEEDAAVDDGQEDVVQERLRCWRVDTWKLNMLSCRACQSVNSDYEYRVHLEETEIKLYCNWRTG
jgi:hypothetical protein